jgi:hypothetical protein
VCFPFPRLARRVLPHSALHTPSTREVLNCILGVLKTFFFAIWFKDLVLFSPELFPPFTHQRVRRRSSRKANSTMLAPTTRKLSVSALTLSCEPRVRRSRVEYSQNCKEEKSWSEKFSLLCWSQRIFLSPLNGVENGNRSATGLRWKAKVKKLLRGEFSL